MLMPGCTGRCKSESLVKVHATQRPERLLEKWGRNSKKRNSSGGRDIII